MLWLRRWLFALVAGVVFTAGRLVTKDIPNLYESSAGSAGRQMLIRRVAIGALGAASVPLLAVLLSHLGVFQILGER
jgi:hypothetical protein